MKFECPQCHSTVAPQIVKTYPPKLFKCTKCGYQGGEKIFLPQPKPTESSSSPSSARYDSLV